MNKTLALAALVLLATGCVVGPYKKPLQPEALAQLPQPTAYVRVDPRGVGVEYFYQDNSAAGAQFGLLGALVVAGIDAGINAGPLKVAEIGADQMATSFQLDKVRTEFRANLDERLKSAPPFNKPIQVNYMGPEQKIEANAFAEPAVFTAVFTSALSQDLRYLHVSADVNIFDKSLLPPEPAKKKAGSKSSTKKDAGLIYRNRFDYYSEKLDPAPEKSQAEIDAAVEAVKAKYPKTRATDSQKIKMRKEIAEAQKPAAPLQKAEFLVKQWLANDSAHLNEKLREGAAEIAKLLARDLSDSAAFDTKAKHPPKTVIEEGNGRVVVRYNTLSLQGTLGSEPVNFAPVATNGVMYSKKQEATPATPESTKK